MRCRIVNSKDILIEKRFDGSYHNADANVYDSVITKHSLHNLSYYCTEIFTSGRNKRTYTTKTYGYPFLSNSGPRGIVRGGQMPLPNQRQ